jgi:apolipoprotein D and lipocalin family protein
MSYEETVDYLDIPQFMGKWYVIGGRLTFMESGAHNAIEIYSWNEAEDRIDVDFQFNKDSFDGKLKKIPQKAWIQDRSTNATWKVSPFWPLKFDYLVIDLDENYKWVAIGVPSENYLWIMSRDSNMDDELFDQIISRLNNKGYNTKEIKRVPQKW